MLKSAVALLVLACGSVPTGQSRTATAGLQQAIDLYERGEYAAALAVFGKSEPRTPREVEGGLREIEAIVEQRSDAAQRQKGRLALSSFILELADSQYRALQQRHRLTPADLPPRAELETVWRDLRPLVEWACSVVRQDPVATEAERKWWRASIDIYQRFRDPDFAPFVGTLSSINPDRLGGHLAHAMTRLPNDPIVALATAERLMGQAGALVGARREMAMDDALRRAAQAGGANPALGLEAADTARNQSLWFTLERQAEAQKMLRPLEELEPVRAAARLHLGAIAVAFGLHDQARRYLSGVADWTSDHRLRYLAFFLRGWLNDGDDRRADAERDYRLALEEIPRAQSATTALGQLLWIDGRTDEAQRLVEAAVGPSENAGDPWPAYRTTGRWSEWPILIEALRRSLK